MQRVAFRSERSGSSAIRVRPRAETRTRGPYTVPGPGRFRIPGPAVTRTSTTRVQVSRLAATRLGRARGRQRPPDAAAAAPIRAGGHGLRTPPPPSTRSQVPPCFHRDISVLVICLAYDSNSLFISLVDLPYPWHIISLAYPCSSSTTLCARGLLCQCPRPLPGSPTQWPPPPLPPPQAARGPPARGTPARGPPARGPPAWGTPARGPPT